MIPGDTRGYKVIPEDTRKNQKKGISGDIRGYQGISGDVRGYQGIPGVSGDTRDD